MRVLAGFLVIAALAATSCGAPSQTPASTSEATAPFPPPGQRDVVAVPRGFPDRGVDPRVAFRQQDKDVWVVGSGTVDRLLREDTKRPRHQRFVLRIDDRQTVMIAHNVDLAPRVPIRHGDRVAFRGRYVWNAQGGVVHWTHRDRGDPQGGGWIVWRGQNFR